MKGEREREGLRLRRSGDPNQYYSICPAYPGTANIAVRDQTCIPGPDWLPSSLAAIGRPDGVSGEYA